MSDCSVSAHEGAISLTSGSTYKITMRHGEGEGGSGVVMAWQKPSDSSYQLFPMDVMI